MSLNAKELREKLKCVPDNAMVLYESIGKGDCVELVTLTRYEHLGSRQIVTLYSDYPERIPSNEVEL